MSAEKFKRRNPVIFAMHHDGTDRRAKEIENWILLNGGKCEVLAIGSHDFDPQHAYIRLTSQRMANLVIPSSYVVMVSYGQFYAVLESDFALLYVEDTSENQRD